MLTSSYDLHAVIALIQEKPEVDRALHLPQLQVTKGNIEFENVTFNYPSKIEPIFNNCTPRTDFVSS